MKISGKFSGTVAALLLCGQAAGADELWDNGVADTGASLGNGLNAWVADDFYVPGGGWYIDGAETRGFFLGAYQEVTDVDVAIYPHDSDTGGPDTDAARVIEVTDFEVETIGNTVFGNEEVRVSVELDRTYLEGQRYFWIEFRVADQYGGTSFGFSARQNGVHEPAHVRGNPYPYPNDGGLDLVFALSGDEVVSLITGLVDDLQAAKPQFEVGSIMLPVGTGGRAQLFRTPAGDDLCGEARGSLRDFCQSFVACAAYDFCN